MHRSKRFLAIAFGVAAAIAGASLGAQVGSPKTASAACAQTECELGSLCSSNTGENTWCATQQAGGCKTKVCTDGDPELPEG